MQREYISEQGVRIRLLYYVNLTLTKVGFIRYNNTSNRFPRPPPVHPDPYPEVVSSAIERRSHDDWHALLPSAISDGMAAVEAVRRHVKEEKGIESLK